MVEGGSSTVVVELSGAPGREVTIPVGISANQGATDADFAVAGFGTVPASVNLTFGPSETRKEITFTATDDSEVDLFESVRVQIAAGTLPVGITLGSADVTNVIIVDNDFNYDVSLVEGAALDVDEAAGTLSTTVRVRTPGDFLTVGLAALNENVVLTVSTADMTATADRTTRRCPRGP